MGKNKKLFKAIIIYNNTIDCPASRFSSKYFQVLQGPCVTPSHPPPSSFALATWIISAAVGHSPGSSHPLLSRLAQKRDCLPFSVVISVSSSNVDAFQVFACNLLTCFPCPRLQALLRQLSASRLLLCSGSFSKLCSPSLSPSW